MRKRSSYPLRLLTPGQITALSDQFICHPASRSIDDIEMAGEIMRALLKQRDELLAAMEQFVTWGRMQHKAQSKGGHATFDMMALKDEIDLAEAAIASVKGGAA